VGSGRRWPGRKINLHSSVGITEFMIELRSSCPATIYLYAVRRAIYLQTYLNMNRMIRIPLDYNIPEFGSTLGMSVDSDRSKIDWTAIYMSINFGSITKNNNVSNSVYISPKEIIICLLILETGKRIGR
jgi:hypothetical protein